MTREQLRELLEDLDAEQLRAALLMIGAFARADADLGEGRISRALWFGLADALGAPAVPSGV